ncbi:glycerol-3-phosphate acyltransferase 2, mitochondrial isoform X2 [Cynoglossus semilaevis]|nr:glycerol-3-phosphate acyltransferase 2, mitochondrial-like isoform X2 [Cynoglossus semilaevis]
MMFVAPCLAKVRPTLGQCCHQCTPDRMYNKLGQSSSLGFRDLLSVNETQTRYRGCLAKRFCYALFVSGCEVYASPVSNRVERVCQSNSVEEVLLAEENKPEGQRGRGQIGRLAPFLPLIKTCISPSHLRFMAWVMLKMFSSLFESIVVKQNHLAALQKVSKEGSLLVYIYVRQSVVDCALIPLVLFCHSLKVPYTLCPPQFYISPLRSVLQKVGVLLLPSAAETQQEAEMDSLYSLVMKSLVCELLHEGQALSVGVSALSGQGGQWLAHITQLIKEGSVPDVNLVPVGISYDSVPQTNVHVVGLRTLLHWLWSVLWRRPTGSVRIQFAQPFSLKEMLDSDRCRVDWLPLQDLLMPAILNNGTVSVFGRRRMSWFLPSHYASDPNEPEDPRRDLSVAVILHLLFLVNSYTAAMSTSLVSSVLLYKQRKGVSLSILCGDVTWLTEEMLFRNRDVGFGGSIADVVRYSLSLLAPYIIVLMPSSKDPYIVPRPSLHAILHLSLQRQTVLQTFISEVVGACAVSAMLSKVSASGISYVVRGGRADGAEVKGVTRFDVVLCQSELIEHALQLCHLLSPGLLPPCQSSKSFALDAIHSLVRCGILIMEEVSRGVPVCDFWKKKDPLIWAGDPCQCDSDCEVLDPHSYKISQPSHCPDMLFFLCGLLAGHLRALCWTTASLDHIEFPLPETVFVAQIHAYLCDMALKEKQHYESCSVEAAHTALRTLIDLGVILEERNEDYVSLNVSPLFQSSGNRQKLQYFIKQYL